MKTFSEIQKLKQFITGRSTLQKILQAEGNDTRWNTDTCFSITDRTKQAKNQQENGELEHHYNRPDPDRVLQQQQDICFSNAHIHQDSLHSKSQNKSQIKRTNVIPSMVSCQNGINLCINNKKIFDKYPKTSNQKPQKIKDKLHSKQRKNKKK